MKRITLGLFFLAVATPAFSQNALIPQYGDSLKKALSGKTLEGFYQSEDVLAGNQSYEETYQKNGTLLYKEGDFTDRGKWWVSNNQLCHNYDIDVPKIDHCFFIYKENNCFYYFESYFARTGKMKHAQEWNNRSIVKGEGKTCELLIS